MKFLQQSTMSERVTAVLSTLFAVAILGVAVTAQQNAVNSTILTNELDPASTNLTQLEKELIAQFEIAYRHDSRLLEAKVAEFNGVLQAWQAAQPSTERDAKLALWIREAMRHSMPGRNQALPAAPDFSPTIAETTPAATSPAPSQDWPASDIIGLENLPTQDTLSSETASGNTELTPVPVDWNDPALNEPFPDESQLASSSKTFAADATPSVPTLVEENASTESTEPVYVRETPVTRGAGESTHAVTPDSPEQHLFAMPEPRQPAVEINVRELSARIAGYHEGLREVEAAVVNRGDDSTSGLAGIVETLEELSVEADFVTLYYDLLTDSQRRFVRAPRPLEPTVVRVQQRLEQAAAPEQGDYLRPFDPSERSKLEALRNRLELLAMRVR